MKILAVVELDEDEVKIQNEEKEVDNIGWKIDIIRKMRDNARCSMDFNTKYPEMTNKERETSDRSVWVKLDTVCRIFDNDNFAKDIQAIYH